MLEIELKPNNPPRERGRYIAQLTCHGIGLTNGPRLVCVEHDCDDIGDPVDTSRPLVVHWTDGHTFPVNELPEEAFRRDDGILWSDKLTLFSSRFPAVPWFESPTP